MSNIYGLLGIPELAADQAFVNTVGQALVFDAVQQELTRINAELNGAISVFVQETTEEYSRRYKLPGSGYMQDRARLARPADTKTIGSWDVAFPLMDFGDAIASDVVSLGYMSIRDLNLHLDGIQLRAANSVRREIMRALFNNAAWAYVDELKGALSVNGLANGDAVLYPPVIGSDAEATENHYLVSGYLPAAISDVNDPVSTIRAEIGEHFDGADCVVFINSAEVAIVQTLTDLIDVLDPNIVAGSAVSTVTGLPENLPGRVIGRHAEGAWVVNWDRVPAHYAMGVALNAPKPIVERVDPASTGLPRGLTMIARDEKFPMETAYYMMRRGFGVGNRLNGVIMDIKAAGVYAVPAAYAR